MEETPEGLAAAAATREAARRKRETALAAAAGASGAGEGEKKAENGEKQATSMPSTTSTAAATGAADDPKPERPPAVHEVLFPPSFDAKKKAAESSSNKNLDPALHGTLMQPRWNGKPAKEFPFDLDPFQQTAVGCLERREAVLVAAHTAAGKTAVAEYAVAMALRDRQRVIYTSPLKALSNQKYRELAEEFGDVGLLTGDVCISPHAPILVMTTEILRSMLYRGDEGLRETAWVVFDEIHYMQDRERGVVWEEAIIFLPKGATPVFLSATLSNASEFASWVAKLRDQPCHVVYTDYRPTPLQHYAFPLGGKGLYLLADERGGFRPDNFSKMRKEAFGLDEEQGEGGEEDGEEEEGIAAGREEGELRGRGRAGGNKCPGAGRGGAAAASSAPSGALSDAVTKMVRLVKERSLDPVIVFSFSRRACEAYATSLCRGDKAKGGDKKRRKKQKVDDGGAVDGKTDDGGKVATDTNLLSFNSEEESLAVDAVFDRAIECISDPGDRSLAAVAAMRPMLRRGVGVHHSGLLPILKELVELLFQEGLVKALFATETFAMGLNMPAKTVVFTELRKWDGQSHRWVTSGEYIQMSGRAGRRGKDDRGVCVSIVDDAFDGTAARSLLKGGAAPLLSSFRLSYYTLLNLARRAGGGAGKRTDAEFVVSRSFRQHQHESATPALQAAAQEAASEADGAAAAALEEVRKRSGGSSEEKVEKMKEKDNENDDDSALSAVVESLVSLLADAERCRRALRDALLNPPSRAAEFLRPGRLVRVRDGKDDWGWGIAVAVSKTPSTAATAAAAGATTKGKGAATIPSSAAAVEETDADATLVVDVLLACEPGTVAGGEPRPASRGSDGALRPGSSAEAHVLPVPLRLVEALSTLRVGVPADLRTAEAKGAALATLRALDEKYSSSGGGRSGGIERVATTTIASLSSLLLSSSPPSSNYPLLDPASDARSGSDPKVFAASERLSGLEGEVSRALSGLGDPKTSTLDALRSSAPAVAAAARARAAALSRSEALRAAAGKSQVGLYRAEAKKRTEVLKKLGHLDRESGSLLTVKGRAAAEVDAADELLASELMFNGVFAGLDPPRLAALVSCLVPCEKSQAVVELAASLAGPLAELQGTARRIAEVQVECGVFARGGLANDQQRQPPSSYSSLDSAEAEAYCESFKPTLMDPVATWASGGTFQQAMDRTEMFEGSLIRAIRRLDEVLGQLAGAAEAVGDSTLASSFSAASASIRRGIVFAASLYI